MYSHPNFYSDFRDQPINWFLIIIGLAFTVFLIATEGIYTIDANRRFHLNIGLPIMVLILVFLIVIQGDWQRFEEDRQILDVLIYLGIFLIAFISYLFNNDVLITSTLLILIFLVRKYYVTRENRLAHALRRE